MFKLYKKSKPLLKARHWEDLVSFVEELKEINNDEFVDRREFVVRNNNEIIYKWNKR